MQRLEVMRVDHFDKEQRGTVSGKTIAKFTVAKDRLSVKLRPEATGEDEAYFVQFIQQINDVVQPVQFTLRGKLCVRDEVIMTYGSRKMKFGTFKYKE